jgi:hypothetical protein
MPNDKMRLRSGVEARDLFKPKPSRQPCSTRHPVASSDNLGAQCVRVTPRPTSVYCRVIKYPALPNCFRSSVSHQKASVNSLELVQLFSQIFNSSRYP